MIPNDPVMLLSFMNMKLRDTGKDLDSLCDFLEEDPNEIIQKLEKIHYYYNQENNRFVTR